MSGKQLCFVLMPFGIKTAGDGSNINFDAVYSGIIKPAIEDAGLEPIRADEEQAGGIIHKPMFERLLLCDFAVADLTTANPNVLYELGVRHAVKPFTTIVLFARDAGQLPFDVGPLRGLSYMLGPGGEPYQPETDRQALAKRLKAAASGDVDSPIYQLVENYPNVQHEKTDVFRASVDYARGMKERLAQARKSGVEALRGIDAELGDLTMSESGIVIDLFLSYRAVKAWSDMVNLVARMPPPLARTVMVREQQGLALNRLGRRDEARKLLEELIKERGPSSETYGILGRVLKDMWDDAAKTGRAFEAKGYLAKAIEAYKKGFETDWRDPYPGINAVTLMELKEPPDPERLKLLPVVEYAVKRHRSRTVSDYWDHATALELAVLKGDEELARCALSDVLAEKRERWERDSTLRNLTIIRRSRERRSLSVGWLQDIEEALSC